jgi:preprotein translocase subunit YajC
MQVQSQVIPGQRIRTTAGLYGTIVSGDDRDIVVEIAPGVHVTMLRRAVMEVLPDDDGEPEDDEPDPQDSAEADDESSDDVDHPFDQTVSADFDSRDADEQPNGSAPADKRATDKRKTKDSNI